MGLHKSLDNRVFAGVCGGIAESLNVDAIWIRLLFVFGGALLFWVYLALWLALPE